MTIRRALLQLLSAIESEFLNIDRDHQNLTAHLVRTLADHLDEILKSPK